MCIFKEAGRGMARTPLCLRQCALYRLKISRCWSDSISLVRGRTGSAFSTSRTPNRRHRWRQRQKQKSVPQGRANISGEVTLTRQHLRRKYPRQRSVTSFRQKLARKSRRRTKACLVIPLNRKRPSPPQTRAIRGDSRRGHKPSDETRARSSAAHLGTVGHKQSPETRAKISATRRARYGKETSNGSLPLFI